MTQRSDCLIRALLARGYSEVKVPDWSDHRRFRISRTHARRLTVYSPRRAGGIFGDLFLTEGGRLLLGTSREIAMGLPKVMVENLLLEGKDLPTKPRPVLTLSELLA